MTTQLRAKLTIEDHDGHKTTEMYGPFDDHPSLLRGMWPVIHRLTAEQVRARNTGMWPPWRDWVMTEIPYAIDGVVLAGRQGKTWGHAPGCSCAVEQTFTCGRCGRRFGWCLGVHGACDFCRPDHQRGTAAR